MDELLFYICGAAVCYGLLLWIRADYKHRKGGDK